MLRYVCKKCKKKFKHANGVLLCLKEHYLHEKKINIGDIIIIDNYYFPYGEDNYPLDINSPWLYKIYSNKRFSPYYIVLDIKNSYYLLLSEIISNSPFIIDNKMIKDCGLKIKKSFCHPLSLTDKSSKIISQHESLYI